VFKKIKHIALGLALSCVAGSAFADTNTEIRELLWEEMIPAGAAPAAEARYSLDELEHLNEIIAEQENSAAASQVVQTLSGQRVKLPAYIVPLESDAQKITEFLLVPYFGACIHVPPPPPNQIVFAIAKDGIENKLFDAVWATGTIHVEHTSSDLAEAGYSMTVEKIEPLDLEAYDQQYPPE